MVVQFFRLSVEFTNLFENYLNMYGMQQQFVVVFIVPLLFKVQVLRTLKVCLVYLQFLKWNVQTHWTFALCFTNTATIV